jgi:outer membrane receptor protein involved in Fe transport
MSLTNRILIIFIIVVKMSIALFGDNGRIGGIIIAEDNQQPLPGANIILMGTLLGAAADLDGGFTIENVPPGDYTLEVLNIGYQSVRQSVTVQSGERAAVRIALPTKVLKSPEIVVTGARRAVRKADSPVTIATISAEQISLRNPTTMEDVLPYESGVQIIDGQINIRGSSGYARGAGTRVSVLVDGFPAISFDNGTIYWEAIPAQDIERVEILKGPGSALYGSSALGGVVNIITKRIPGGTHTKVSLSQGIYSKPSDEMQVWTNQPMNLGEYRLAHSRSFGSLKLAASLAQNNSRGYYQNGWYRRTILESRAEYSPGQNRQLLSRLFYILDRHGSFTQWKSPFQPFHTPDGTQDDAINTSKLQWSTAYSQIVSPHQSRLFRFHLFQTGFDNELYNNTTSSRARTAQSELQLDLRPNQTHYLTTGVDLKLHQVTADIWGDHHGWDAAVYLQD